MDLPTLLICSTLINFIMMLTMVAMYMVSSSEKYLIDWFACGAFFCASSLLAIVTAYFSLPLLIHPALGNALYLAGHAALLSGISRCLYNRSNWRFVALVLLSTLAVHYVPVVAESVKVRILIFYPLIIALDIAAMMALWRHRHEKVGKAFYPLIIILLLFAGQLFFRGCLLLIETNRPAIIEHQLLQTLGSLAAIAFVFLLTIGFSVVVTWKKELTLQRASMTDFLTGWYNRKALQPFAEREFARCQRTGKNVAFIVFDIDHFKAVNDNYGHAAGDIALQHVCNMARGQIRGYDNYFRLGGEEFAVLITDLSPAALQRLANRIRQAIEHNEINLQGTMLKLTISIGLAMARDQHDNWQAVLERADRAVYQSKAQGRNLVTSCESVVDT